MGGIAKGRTFASWKTRSASIAEGSPARALNARRTILKVSARKCPSLSSTDGLARHDCVIPAAVDASPAFPIYSLATMNLKNDAAVDVLRMNRTQRHGSETNAGELLAMHVRELRGLPDDARMVTIPARVAGFSHFFRSAIVAITIARLLWPV